MRSLGATVALGLALSMAAQRVTGQDSEAVLRPRPAERPAPMYVWVQAHPDRWVSRGEVKGRAGGLLARAVLPEGVSCPGIWVDGVERRMTERLPAQREDFPVTVCEAVYPGHAHAIVAGRRLPRRVDTLRRILVIGDTGCRVDAARLRVGTHQHCSDPEAWPFGALAHHLSGLQPDLIVHLGDFHYREVPCPGDVVGCAGSPGGDNWPTWRSELFEPAAPLLLSAPWVMVRGNHERCGLAGVGWSHLLEPRVGAGQAAGCRDDTQPYWLDLGDRSMLVLDTAAAGLPDDTLARATRYRGWMRDALDTPFNRGREPPARAWLTLHHPLWQWPATRTDGQAAEVEPAHALAENGASALAAISRSLFDHVRSGRAPLVDQVLSGHVHHHQTVAPPEASPVPWQITVGNGGATLHSRKSLAPMSGTRDQPLRIGKRLVGTPPLTSLEPSAELGFDASASFHFGFGYAVLATGENADWTMTAFDGSGTPVLECSLSRWSAGDPGLERGCRATE